MQTYLRWGAAAIWTVLILVIVLIPPPDVPTTGTFPWDKVAHVGLFFIFGILWSLVDWSPRAVGWILLGGLVYAGTTELFQGLLPWEREPDLMDMIANVSGLILALATAQGVRRAVVTDANGP